LPGVLANEALYLIQVAVTFEPEWRLASVHLQNLDAGEEPMRSANSSRSLALLSCIVAMSVAADARGQGFTFIDAPDVSSSYPSTRTIAINNNGDVILEGATAYYIFSKGVYTPISLPGPFPYAEPYLFNDNGDIVYGLRNSQTGVYSPYLLHNGVSTLLAYPGATQTSALMLNDDGAVYGVYSLVGTVNGDGTLSLTSAAYGFKLVDGVYSSYPALTPPNIPSPPGYGVIDSAGDVAWETVNSSVNPHLYTGYTNIQGVQTSFPVSDFGFVPGMSPSLAGFNSPGDLIGNLYDENAVLSHGILRHNGVWTIVDGPGINWYPGPDTTLVAINDSGLILGNFADNNAHTKRGFTLQIGNGPAPSAPGNVQVGVNTTDGQPCGGCPNPHIGGFIINWQDTSDNEDGFLIASSVDGRYFSLVANVPANTTSYIDYGPRSYYYDSNQLPSSGGDPAITLMPVYYYVMAWNTSGTVQGNTDWTIAPDNPYRPVACPAQPCTIPWTPSHLAAGQSSVNPRTQINVYWKDNGGNEQGFHVYRSVDGGLTFTLLATVSGNTSTEGNMNSYWDAGLIPGTAYYYYVTAFNPAGESPASNTDGTITAP
jgi:hypothetical protein